MMIHRASYLTKLSLGAASAALLIAGLTTSCNQNKTAAPAAKSDTSASAPASEAKGAEIVYINQDTLMSKYDYVKDMGERLEKKGKSAQSAVQSRLQAIQREYVDYQKNAATMSADQRAAIEQRLQKKGQEQQVYEQNASAEFQGAQAEENDKLFKKVTAFLEKYAKDKGYKMVLSYSRTNPVVLYGDKTLDVTSDVIKGLNEDYKADKK